MRNFYGILVDSVKKYGATHVNCARKCFNRAAAIITYQNSPLDSSKMPLPERLHLFKSRDPVTFTARTATSMTGRARYWAPYRRQCG